MKKNIIVIFLLVVIQGIGHAQDLSGNTEWRKDVLRRLDTARQDTSRVLLLVELGGSYKFIRPDSGLYYEYKALALARHIKFAKGEVAAMMNIGITHISLGNDPKALQIDLQAAKIAEKNNLIFERGILLLQLGIIYARSEDYKKAMSSFRESLKLLGLLYDVPYYSYVQNRISAIYLVKNQLDSALHYNQLAYDNVVPVKNESWTWATHDILLNLGDIKFKTGNTKLALTYYQQSLLVADELDKISSSYFSIAKFYKEINKPDSSIYYAQKSLEIAQRGSFLFKYH